MNRVEAIVREIDVALCSSAANHEAGLAFVRGLPQWSELTSPGLASELKAHVDACGLESMNKTAREFFSAALDESARRSGP